MLRKTEISIVRWMDANKSFVESNPAHKIAKRLNEELNIECTEEKIQNIRREAGFNIGGYKGAGAGKKEKLVELELRMGLLEEAFESLRLTVDSKK